MMTKAATVVRHNDAAARSLSTRCASWHERAEQLLALRHRQLDEPERGVHQGAARHVPAGQGDPQGRLAARRMPRGPLQARLRHAGHRSHRSRPSVAARPKPGATSSKRTPRKWLKTHDRHARRRRRAAAELRRRRHVADPAAAAAVRPGRRRSDRRSLEGAAGRRRPRPAATATATAAQGRSRSQPPRLN